MAAPLLVVDFDGALADTHGALERMARQAPDVEPRDWVVKPEYANAALSWATPNAHTWATMETLCVGADVHLLSSFHISGLLMWLSKYGQDRACRRALGRLRDVRSVAEGAWAPTMPAYMRKAMLCDEISRQRLLTLATMDEHLAETVRKVAPKAEVLVLEPDAPPLIEVFA